MTTKHLNPWDWDIRVRGRNLKAGILSEKDIEKHNAQLPDLADQVEGFSLPQPALGGREETPS
jgi:hypothetical protein